MAQEIGDGRVKASLVCPCPRPKRLWDAFEQNMIREPEGACRTHHNQLSFHSRCHPSADTLDRLTKVFASTQPHSFTFSHIARFPNVLYLAPSPSAPFERLTARIAHEFPESPPYGGQYDSVTPHLTVADSKDRDLPGSVEREFSDAAAEYLPLEAFADRVWLMDDSTGRWEKRLSFSLGGT